MEFRSFPEAIKSILDQRGWTQSTLAREWGRHQTWVSKTMRGERDTPIGEAARLLASVGYEVVIRPKREKSAPVKRREFHNKIITLASAAVAGKAASATLVPSAKLPAFRNHAYVMALADHIKVMRNELGGARLISTAHDYIERIGISDVIQGGDRKLQVATARLVNVHALTLYDADRLNQAEGAARTALALARASEDPDIQALMHATLSQIATWAGAGDRGWFYAQEGLRITGISDVLRAELIKRKMRSLAVLPQKEERVVLRAYEDIRELDQGSQDSFRVDSFKGLSLNFGIALSDLGQHQAAIRAFSDSAKHYAEWSPHYYAQALHGEVTSLLHARMIEDAANSMVILAHTLPLTNSAQLRKQVKEILAASTPWARVTKMRAAREQLRGVVSVAS
jgi:transcriptional regulator with XRE-family HTH domain